MGKTFFRRIFLITKLLEKAGAVIITQGNDDLLSVTLPSTVLHLATVKQLKMMMVAMMMTSMLRLTQLIEIHIIRNQMRRFLIFS